MQQIRIGIERIEGPSSSIEAMAVNDSGFYLEVADCGHRLPAACHFVMIPTLPSILLQTNRVPKVSKPRGTHKSKQHRSHRKSLACEQAAEEVR